MIIIVIIVTIVMINDHHHCHHHLSHHHDHPLRPDDLPVGGQLDLVVLHILLAARTAGYTAPVTVTTSSRASTEGSVGAAAEVGPALGPRALGLPGQQPAGPHPLAGPEGHLVRLVRCRRAPGAGVSQAGGGEDCRDPGPGEGRDPGPRLGRDPPREEPGWARAPGREREMSQGRGREGERGPLRGRATW